MPFLYESYDATPDNNNAAPPIGAPEGGTSIQSLNDIDRHTKAAVAELGQRTPKLPSDPSTLGSGITDTSEIGSAAYSTATDFAIADAGVPIGGVIPFYGTALQIPANYNEMDGSSVTIQYPAGNQSVTLPDMRDKYLIGASATKSEGATGGNDSVNTGAAGGHDHGGNTQGHALAENEMPEHGHPTRVSVTSASSAQQDTTGGFMLSTVSDSNQTAHNSPTPGTTAGDQIGTAGDGDPHEHGITAEADHQHTVAIQPSYVALRMIIRLS